MSITNTNIKAMLEIIQELDDVVVKFYKPDNECAGCKLLAPKYKQISEEYKNLTCLEVNANDEDAKQFLIENSVRSIPALFYYKNGELITKDIGDKPLQYLKTNLEKTYL